MNRFHFVFILGIIPSFPKECEKKATVIIIPKRHYVSGNSFHPPPPPGFNMANVM